MLSCITFVKNGAFEYCHCQLVCTYGYRWSWWSHYDCFHFIPFLVTFYHYLCLSPNLPSVALSHVAWVWCIMMLSHTSPHHGCNIMLTVTIFLKYFQVVIRSKTGTLPPASRHLAGSIPNFTIDDGALISFGVMLISVQGRATTKCVSIYHLDLHQ